MARHVVSPNQPRKTSEGEIGTGVQAPVQGGSLGVPEAIAKVPSLAESFVGSARRDPLERSADVAPKRYRVIGGPQRTPGRISVMYDGARSDWAMGKEVTHLTHNLDLLRAQGLILEEIKDNTVPTLLEGEYPPIPEATIDA
jgi:hypothetical protein